MMNPIERYMKSLDEIDGKHVTVTRESSSPSVVSATDVTALVAALKEHERRGNPVPWS